MEEVVTRAARRQQEHGNLNGDTINGIHRGTPATLEVHLRKTGEAKWKQEEWNN